MDTDPTVAMKTVKTQIDAQDLLDQDLHYLSKTGPTSYRNTDLYRNTHEYRGITEIQIKINDNEEKNSH